MSMIELLAYSVSLLSIWIIATGRRWGFLLGAANFIPWAILAWNHHLPGMIAFSACIAGGDIRAYFKWKGANK